MKCRFCKKNPATITIAKGTMDYDVCKNCVDEMREKDRKKDLVNPSFSVRCVWKEGM